MARILIEIDGDSMHDGGAARAAAAAAASYLATAGRENEPGKFDGTQLASLAETIYDGGGAVEIGGIRITRADAQLQHVQDSTAITGVHLHHEVGAESTDEQVEREVRERDEPTDVTELAEAPEPQPERKRRTKAELEKAAALEAQGYSADDVKEYQLRGKPLPALPGEASSDGEPEPGDVEEAPAEQPAANPAADAWTAGTDAPQHGTPPVEEVQPATSTEDTPPADNGGWAPQWN